MSNAFGADDGVPPEMSRLPFPRRRRAGTPALDDDTLSRLLDGRISSADAPPGYAGVAAVLAAATGPPTPDELQGEASAVIAFAATPRTTDSPRRNDMHRKLPVRILAIAAVGFAFGGVAAALTGGDEKPKDDTTVNITEASEPDTASAQGPDPTGPAKFGLCNAYSSGQGGEHGKKNDSTAFDALEEAAGVAPTATDEERAAAVTAFCADVLADKGGDGEGAGNGQGGPPEELGRGDHGPSQQGQDNSNGKAGGGQGGEGEE
jgi:hypothetical protein